MDLKTYIGELNGRKLQPTFKPIPANIALKSKKFNGIKAILCDVYGTLVKGKSNSVGDLEKNKQNSKYFNKTINEFKFKNALMKINKNKSPSKLLKELYLEEIKEAHEKKNRKGIAYPEVLIENIWKSIIKNLILNGYSYNKKVYGTLREFSFKVAYFYQYVNESSRFYSNVFSVLQGSKKRGILLGLVSNAQFYTPINLDMELKRHSKGRMSLYKMFNKDIISFSYKVGQSKPGKKIFSKVLNSITKKKIKKKHTIFIGNDTNKDIKPASQIGFKTVLFAGDKNSLKYNRESVPDAIITDWKQLLKIIN